MALTQLALSDQMSTYVSHCLEGGIPPLNHMPHALASPSVITAVQSTGSGSSNVALTQEQSRHALDGLLIGLASPSSRMKSFRSWRQVQVRVI